jgi:hypothetical protein
MQGNSTNNKRPPGLIAIIIYKAFVALLLGITSVVLLLALKNYDNLIDFSESYVLEGKLAIIEWVILSMPKGKRYS